MGTLDLGDGAAKCAVDRLTSLLRAWDGVEVVRLPHRVVQYRVANREIGHVHANGVADLPFPVRLRRDLVAAGRAEPHHMLPQTGWVSVRLRTEHDVPSAVAIFRLSYERLRGTYPGAGTRLGILPVLVNPSMLGNRLADDLPA